MADPTGESAGGALRLDFYPMRYTLAHPRGRFLLVYPLSDVAQLPTATHAYYPRTAVLCPSIAPPSGLCPRTSRALRSRLAALRLRTFGRRPAQLVRLLPSDRRSRDQSNLARAFELAFARTYLARPAFYPRRCAHPYRAEWKGPNAGPRRFCLGRLGLYARARIFPIPPGLYEVATAG